MVKKLKKKKTASKPIKKKKTASKPIKKKKTLSSTKRKKKTSTASKTKKRASIKSSCRKKKTSTCPKKKRRILSVSKARKKTSLNSNKDEKRVEVSQIQRSEPQNNFILSLSLRQEIENQKRNLNEYAEEIRKLKEENNRFKLESINHKQSIRKVRDFIDSIDSGTYLNFIQNQNKLDQITEELKNIQFKEIRNTRIEEKFCITEHHKDFICSICLDIVEDPVCCSYCESLNCKICVSNTNICPNCRKQRKEAPIPRIVKNSLSALKIRCPLLCSKTFNYEEKAQHFSVCIYKEYINPKCSLCQLTIRDSLTIHGKTCEKLVTKCLFCNVTMSKLELKEHLSICQYYEKFCSRCKTGYPNRFEQAHSEYYCNKILRLKKQISDLMQAN